MHKKYIWLIGAAALVALTLIALLISSLFIPHANYGFHTAVSSQEQQLRMQVVDTAIRWLGTQGCSDAHKRILEIYNSHEPLAQGYIVQTEDAWCATFVSTVAIQCGLTDRIPTECGCQRQIGLWQQLGQWEEADDYIPLPGDIIYYCMAESDYFGDCDGHSDHVGIVVGTWGGFIKVIEGNCNNEVAYRYIPINSYQIRGFGLPKYSES